MSFCIFAYSSLYDSFLLAGHAEFGQSTQQQGGIDRRSKTHDLCVDRFDVIRDRVE